MHKPTEKDGMVRSIGIVQCRVSHYEGGSFRNRKRNLTSTPCCVCRTRKPSQGSIVQSIGSMTIRLYICNRSLRSTGLYANDHLQVSYRLLILAGPLHPLAPILRGDLREGTQRRMRLRWWSAVGSSLMILMILPRVAN